MANDGWLVQLMRLDKGFDIQSQLWIIMYGVMAGITMISQIL